MSQNGRLSGLLGMRLFLLGATGNTGTEILELALSRGHQVTAFVRSPQKLAPSAGLQIVAGDPRNRAALSAALVGHDAVLSALGPPPREALRPGSSLLAECASALVDAMRSAGVARIAIVSAAVLFPEKGLYFTFFQWLLRHHAHDLRAMESVVQASRLEWTIARPPRLVRGPDLAFRALRDALPKGSRSMSFRAVAAFMLEAVEQRSHVHEVIGLAG
jgi:putative NADH-flavin reductase